MLYNIIQEMRRTHPVQCSWLGRSHDHAHKLFPRSLIYWVNCSRGEPLVALHKLAQLIIDFGVLVTKEDSPGPELALDVDKAHLSGFSSLLPLLVNVRRAWRRSEDESFHLAVLLEYLFVRAR